MKVVKSLEKEFFEVLTADFKGLPKRITTLFDIAEFPERERVISNFYTFYFYPLGEHGFGDLFISTLSKLIASKTGLDEIIKNYKFCEVDKEVGTDKGNFIDIVITESSANENINENAIIIENKINAPVYNNLADYYQHVQVKNKKIGVVLSLKKEKNLPIEYINITHLEFINKIQEASGSYFLNAEAKQLIILKEFLQNIKSMALKNELNEQYDFYFKHEKKIRELAELYKVIVADVFRQADDACQQLNMGLELKATNADRLRFYASAKAPIYFKIWLKDLMTDAEYMCIAVELNAEGIKHLDKINKINFTEEEDTLLYETDKIRKNYLQYARKNLEPTEEQIKNFTEYIYNEITSSPLKSIFLKLKNRLAELKADDE